MCNVVHNHTKYLKKAAKKYKSPNWFSLIGALPPAPEIPPDPLVTGSKTPSTEKS